MPVYRPNILFSDDFGSAGDRTWYHRYGRCYTRKRASIAFPGTVGQAAQVDVHRRALAAWRSIPQETPMLWNDLSIGVESHRPPFDHQSGISGQNLFVSAYHGFCTLGNEHLPIPQPYERFPSASLTYDGNVAVEGADLIIGLSSFVGDRQPERYRVLARFQLVASGRGCHPGKMRNCLAEENCPSTNRTIHFRIKDYKTRWGLDLNAYTIHCQYRLLVTKTGYRNNAQRFSFDIHLTPPSIHA